jgi:hypothetical protein
MAVVIDQQMEVDEIHRPKHGWKKVYVCRWDERLHLLRGDSRGVEQWHFGVCLRSWRGHDWQSNAVDHLEGPFPDQQTAELAARRWFVKYPAGSVAELLAREPYMPEIRTMLTAVNEGDLVAWEAFLDCLKEHDTPEPLIDAVDFQMTYMGIRPIEVSDNQVA